MGDRAGEIGSEAKRAQLLSILLDSVNDLVWCTALNGRDLVYVNPATQRVFGYTLAELHADPELWLDRVHPEDRSRVAENFCRRL